MFGNNHAPKKYKHYLQVTFELQGIQLGGLAKICGLQVFQNFLFD